MLILFEKCIFLSDGTGAGWKSGIIREMNMEIFYSKETDGVSVLLDREESAHCVKVLRHRPGDEVTVVDGKGTMYRCRLEDDSLKGARATVL